jgi:sulfane dehydrogenase subunit SoxC
VEVSSDGGASWKEATLSGPNLPACLTRFRLSWEWNGAEAMLQSRAMDDKGTVQQSRAEWIAQYSPGNRYHNTMIQTWGVSRDGRINNVYL